MTPKDLDHLANNIFQQGEGGYIISRDQIVAVLREAAKALTLAEAVCAATVRLESAFDIQDTPNQSPAERNLARCLNVWRAAKGNK